MNNMHETKSEISSRILKPIPGAGLLFIGVVLFLLIAVWMQQLLILRFFVLAMLGVVGVWFTYHNPLVLTALAISTQFMGGVYVPYLSYGRYGIPYYMFFASLALFGYGLRCLTGRDSIRFPIGTKYWFAYMALVILSLFNVRDFGAVLGTFARPLFDWIIFFLLLQVMKDRQSMRRLFRYLALQALIMLIWWLWVGIRIYVFNVPTYHIFLWQNYQKNNLSVYFSFVLVSALSLYYQSKNGFLRLAILPVIFAIPVAWAISYSRSGLLALVMSIAVYYFLERRRSAWQKAFLILMVVLLLAAAMFMVAPQGAKDMVFGSVSSLVTLGQTGSERFTTTIDLRIELIRSAIDVFMQHPLFGVGFHQWQYYSPITTVRADVQTEVKYEMGYSIHNSPLALAVNSGVIALAMYVFFVANLLVVSLRLLPRLEGSMRGILIAFIAAFIGIQVGLQFAPTVIWEWPMLGLLAGLINLIDQELYPSHKNHRIVSFKKVRI